MEKHNYMAKINNPIKKSSKNKDNKLEYSNSKSDEHNSGIDPCQVNDPKGINKDSKINISNLDLNNNKQHNSIKNRLIYNYKYDNDIKNNRSSINSSMKMINKKDICKIKVSKKKNKSLKKNITTFNKEKNFPGYYNLIQINANNSKNNKPPESKYILDNYEEAIQYETRHFWRIYFICLLSKENILNTFFFKSPLESQPIRISLFIFSYSCDFALNALFYLNQKISDKYHYEGNSLYYFTFINNITISIFSTVFSNVLIKLFNFLTNSKDSIEELFRE